jgi:hypothetical protein
MGQLWKRADWNSIIQRVNTLSANPSAGCSALPALSEALRDNNR